MDMNSDMDTNMDMDPVHGHEHPPDGPIVKAREFFF
jgi:hypothetical protein